MTSIATKRNGIYGIARYQPGAHQVEILDDPGVQRMQDMCKTGNAITFGKLMA